MPGAIPVASPVVLIIATPAALFCHVKVTLLSTFPFTSFAVAVNCWVWPALMLALMGESETDVTGVLEFTTVTTAAALLIPEVEAVICAEPSLWAVTTPVLSTLAISGALLSQVNVAPLIAFPLESFAVAVNDSCALMAMKAFAGVMMIVLTAPVDELPQPSSNTAIAGNNHKTDTRILEKLLSSVGRERARMGVNSCLGSPRLNPRRSAKFPVRAPWIRELTKSLHDVRSGRCYTSR
jgi:hypothetical protein